MHLPEQKRAGSGERPNKRFKSNVFRMCAWAQRERSLGARFQYCQRKHWRSDSKTSYKPSSKAGGHKWRPPPWRLLVWKREKELSVRVLVFTFTFLFHKVQDGDGPVWAAQEPRDALHHPFYFFLLFRSHPDRGAPRNLGPDPRSQLRPFGRREQGTDWWRASPAVAEEESYKLVNVKWSLWQLLCSRQPPGSGACFCGACAF